MTTTERPADVVPSSERPHLVIRPRGRFAAVDLQQIWQYRDLLRTFAKRDVTLRYRQTALGVVWVVLQPLLTALIFTFVFGRVAHLSADGVPHLVFSYTGLLAWNIFNGGLTRGSGSMVGASAMVSKVYFPRLIVPLSVFGSVLLDFGVSLVVEAVMLVGYGINPGVRVLLVPVWLLPLVVMSTGLAVLTSGLTVRYRDVQYVVPLLVQLLLFASPVGYSVSNVPHSVRWAVSINPLTGILEAFRWSLLGTGPLQVDVVVYSFVAAVVVFVAGALVFTSLERDFADVI